MDNVRKETHVVSVMNLQLETVVGFTDEKDNRPLPNQIRRARLTAREKNHQIIQATEMKALQTKRGKIPRRYRNCDNPSCSCWQSSRMSKLQVWDWVQVWQQVQFSTCWGRWEAQQKGQRKVVRKDQLLYWRGLYNWIVCLKTLIQENLFYGKTENWDQITP